MKIFKILLASCLVCLCRCQEDWNNTVIDNDSKEDLNSTTSLTSLNDEKTSQTTNPDIIITRRATTNDISSTTEKENNNNISDSSTTHFSTPKEEKFSACEINPCKNGGICIEDHDDSRVYICMCPTGFTGTRCNVKDFCVADGKIDCKNGFCSYSEDWSLRSCRCFFGQFWDDAKEECRNAEPPCFPNPCQNGGECKKVGDENFKCACFKGYEGPTCNVQNNCGADDHCSGGKCEKKEEENVKMCTCFEGKYWNEISSKCEEKEPPCVPNPCENGGGCQRLPSGDFKCHCSGHYVGKKCEIDNLCYNNDSSEVMCGGKGSCQIFGNTPQCVCFEGYYFDIESRTCRENIPPCFPNPCANDGLCIPTNGDFNCTCSNGYTGKLCKDPDFCVLLGGEEVCGEAHCKSSNYFTTYQCQCDDGFYFDFNERECLEIDFCPIMTCGDNERCVSSKCVCQDKFEWNNKTNKCEANFCATNPCPSEDMICTEGDGAGDFYCSCKEGYSFNGANCKEAVCVFPQFNNCDQECLSSNEGFTCKCNSHYFSLDEDNKTCHYTGNETCSNKTCNLGKCIKDDKDEETCVCSAGYTEENGNCIDICKSKSLPEGICPGDQCESTNNGFRCKCGGKYVLSKDKVTCTNRRMCEKGEVGAIACAAKNAACFEDWNNDLGYFCQCTFPQKESNQGICQDVCDNEEYQRKCSILNARCDVHFLDGDMICRCPPLYKPTRNGEICNQLADSSYLITIPLDLDSYTTDHKGVMKRSLEDSEYSADYFHINQNVGQSLSKIFPGLHFVNVINCKKNVDFYLCTIELQFVPITYEELKRVTLPDFCLSTKDSLDKCLVPPSLILRKSQLLNYVTIKESDPCNTDVKEKLCGSETVCKRSQSKKSFNCTCDQGYEMRQKIFPFVDSSSVIEVCNDINECLVDGICPDHAKCQNLIGGYTCTCMPGYRNKDKLSDPKVNGCVELCDPNPCNHGVCEKIGDADFACSCLAGYTGVLCDLIDSNFNRAQTNTIIVGAVLGGVLLITLIIFFVKVHRLKKKKHEDPDHMVYGAEMNERRGGAVNNAYQ